MNPYNPTGKYLLITMAIITLTGCAPQQADETASNRSATGTVGALDALAAGTIEALQDLDSTATSAARTAQPTATEPPPTRTMTATLTPTLEFVEVEVSVDTNCRSGPNVAFDYVGALLVGERTQVVARTDTPGYFIVDNPDRPGRTCWLWDRHATLYGDPTRLPLVESPATPTPAPAGVAGWTFVDTNSNGTRDAHESDDGIAGVALVLRVGSCPGGIVAYSTQSESSGRYRFPVVLAARYCLTTDPALNPGQYSLSLGSGEFRDGLNFWQAP